MFGDNLFANSLWANNNYIFNLNIPEDDLDLDWGPSKNLIDGLEITVDYYKNKLNIIGDQYDIK